MTTTRTRTLVVAVTVLAVSALAACGDDDEPTEARRDDPPAATEVVLRPAGTELAEGLVVPEDARLAGAVFRQSGYDRESIEPLPPVTVAPIPLDEDAPPASPTTAGPDVTMPPLERDPEVEEWTALLVIEGDPFAVLDDLAAQVRELGPALSGSRDACVWQVDGESDVTAPSGPVAVAAGPPALPIDHLRCEASASDGTRHLTVSLRYGGEHPGTLVVERVAEQFGGGPSSYGEGAIAAQEREQGPSEPEPVVPDGSTDGTTTSTTHQPPDTLPVPGPEPVGDDVRDLLPDPAPQPDPETGERFGGTGNCLATGYDQMVLPAGATLVATEAGGDGVSVLATDDVEATMDALLASGADGPDASSFDPSPRERIPLADGSTVSSHSFSISAGGGGCNLLASPDGGYVLVTMYSD